MNRRSFMCRLVFGLVAVAALANAQHAARIARVGLLSASGAEAFGPSYKAFIDGLREAGWVEGRNLVIEAFYADNSLDRLPALASELVALHPDVIFAPVTPAALAAQKATSRIPIVFALAADPVGTGLVANLARPEANITGLASLNSELAAKRLQLLKEVLPSITRVAILVTPGNAPDRLWVDALDRAAPTAGVTLLPISVRTRADLERAFPRMAKERVEALILIPNPLLLGQEQLAVDLAARHKLPTIYWDAKAAAAGGLISYGVSYADQFRRAAGYVDRILRGVKPGDLPVEQPTRFELAINMKTAKALGLTIPQSLMLRADEVIQ